MVADNINDIKCKRRELEKEAVRGEERGEDGINQEKSQHRGHDEGIIAVRVIKGKGGQVNGGSGFTCKGNDPRTKQTVSF